MSLETLLPEGITSRPATLADFEAIYDLVQAYELAHCGEVDQSLEDVQTNWTAPGVNLEEDSRLVFRQDGQLIGYMRLMHHQYAKYDCTIRIRPDYSDPRPGDYLLELAESWVRERMAQAEPGARVSLSSWCPGGDRARRQSFAHASLQEIRLYWLMEIEMREAPPTPVWPKGIELRPYVPKRDERMAFHVVDTAFLDHWGYAPSSFEEWKHEKVERDKFDPSLWFIAYQGDQAVGGSYCFDEGVRGWIDDLAVLRPARGKGLGMALLLHSFGEFYRRGKHRVCLVVDSQNLTGAQHLYQKAGMQRVRERVSHEKELRAGVERSTRALEV